MILVQIQQIQKYICNFFIIMRDRINRFCAILQNVYFCISCRKITTKTNGHTELQKMLRIKKKNYMPTLKKCLTVQIL